MWWWIITFLEKVWLVHTMMYAVDWNYIPRYSKWIQLVHICLPIVSRDMMMNYYIPWKKVWQLHAMMYAVDWKLYTTISKVNTMVNRCVPIVSRDMMMNYCIPWKSLTGAYHDVRRGLKIIHTTISKVNTMVNRCVPIVSRDMMMNYCIPWKSLTGAYHDVRRGLKIIHTTISKVNTTVIQRYTSVFHCLQRYDDFTLVIAISVDRKLYSIVYICLQRYTYSGNHGCHDVRRGLKIIHTTIFKVNTMIYICLPLSPEIWWFHYGHRDIRGLKLYFHCLQRCDDELLHSLKKSLTSEYHDARRGLKLYFIVSRDVMISL